MSSQYSTLQGAIESITPTADMTSADISALSSAITARAVELGDAEITARGYGVAFLAIGDVVVNLGVSSMFRVR